MRRRGGARRRGEHFQRFVYLSLPCLASNRKGMEHVPYFKSRGLDEARSLGHP